MKILLLVSLFGIALFAQTKDSLLFKSPGDSSLVRDSSLTKKKYDVDTVIYSSASDSLIFYVDKKKMDLYGDAEMQYQQTDLKSAKIFVDFETNNIDAAGVPSDSFPGKFKGTPVLVDKGEPYDGITMKFNFKTSRGFISKAGSKLEGAFYNGDKIKRMDKETYFIEDGIYTTCDATPPHYYFYAHEMKVIQKEEIVARWIWLYFGGVPFPIPIPFAVFPIESGRRSGIVIPAFGDDATYGYYFSKFGYFWAVNDYLDANLISSYFTRGSYDLSSRLRYAKRYDFSGNIQADYIYRKNGLPSDQAYATSREWNLSINHNQTIDPTLRLDANLQYSSKNYNQTNVTNFNELLQNNIFSNATLFKNWEESGNSLSLSYSRTQNLQSGDINEVLPNLTFSLAQNYPFRGKDVTTDQKWYDLLGFNYSGQFENLRNKTGDDLQIRGGFNHQLSTSFSPKIGYFNFTPNFSYNEKWYNKYIEEGYVRNPATGEYIRSQITGADSFYTSDKYKLNAVRTFNMGVSTQTKFYGIFNPDILGIASIRHTVNPSISYNYSPDFSKPGWGYYSTYVDTQGIAQHYDKFQREVYGGVSSGEQQNISFSLTNIFEMKTKVDPTDTTSKEKKIQLLNLSANMSYNFAADSLKFSDLSISYRTQVGDLLNISGSSSFTPYDYYNEYVTRINKFLINEGKGLFRMTDLSFSISTSLSGEKLKSKETEAKKPEDRPANELENIDRQIYQGIYSQKEADFSIPWTLSLSYNYSLSRPTPISTFKYSNLNGSIDFNLTPAWKFSVAGSYDFGTKQFAAPQIRITRDLHCWVMNFTWNPIGPYRGYNLEIKVKAPQLEDLKLTKRSDFYTGK
ncbi:MAG: putative LPS assembly protein LptD [Ignavibacteriaceae bacterium]|nr:putative LPS assembly protein LptD [Ignavibacteriaceae bacterium]